MDKYKLKGKLVLTKPTRSTVKFVDSYWNTGIMLERVIRNIIHSILEEPLGKALLEDELNKLPRVDQVLLSEVRIDKACEIHLAGYNEQVQVKGYQARTLYIFYLLAPVGIAYQELPAYKPILKDIYLEVCKQKLNDDYRSEHVIGGMLERKGGVSDATNKIRTALKKIIKDERILEYYMMNGRRSACKRVALPRHLVKIENEVLNKILNAWSEYAEQKTLNKK